MIRTVTTLFILWQGYSFGVGTYHTVKSHGSGEYIENGSRFIAQAKMIASRQEANIFFKEVCESMSGASHNVTAYVIGISGMESNSNDDGEPAGCAGAPILDMLRSEGLIDIAIVVSRFFGGRKLGIGGLVRAYTRAAKEAINSAGIIVLAPRQAISVKTGYDLMPKMENMLISKGCSVVEKTHGKVPTYKFLCDIGQIDEITSSVNKISKNEDSMELLSIVYVPD